MEQVKNSGTANPTTRYFDNGVSRLFDLGVRNGIAAVIFLPRAKLERAYQNLSLEVINFAYWPEFRRPATRKQHRPAGGSRGIFTLRPAA